jgi:hypothetical protein
LGHARTSMRLKQGFPTSMQMSSRWRNLGRDIVPPRATVRKRREIKLVFW